MSAKVKVTLGEVESIYRCTYPFARAIETIMHHSDSAEEVKEESTTQEAHETTIGQVIEVFKGYIDNPLIEDKTPFKMAIKAFETIGKLQTSCDKYIADGVGYYGYIKIGVAKQIVKEFINDN